MRIQGRVLRVAPHIAGGTAARPRPHLSPARSTLSNCNSPFTSSLAATYGGAASDSLTFRVTSWGRSPSLVSEPDKTTEPGEAGRGPAWGCWAKGTESKALRFRGARSGPPATGL